jgi:anthranilate phosphoribosyltransferase
MPRDFLTNFADLLYAQGKQIDFRTFGEPTCSWSMSVQTPHLTLFGEVLDTLLARRDLDAEQVRAIVRHIMSGACGEAEVAAFLIALRMKGETAVELAAAASVLREHMVRWESGRSVVLDTCGTGGDGTGTLNISTAAAFLVAGAGVAVVKHGNRSVSSRSGSADVLAALGIKVEGDAVQARRCLDHAGLAFCFAPQFHPALRHVAGLRRRLRVTTLFNCLGPLANPAGATHQLLGVGRPELLDVMAAALARLGARRALVVCGRDGLDEVSLSAPTQVRDVHGSDIRALEWTAGDFGLEPCSLGDLRVDGPEQSAARLRAILDGQDGPMTRVVLANAAAGLLAAEQVRTPAEGVARASEALTSGKSRQVLERLVQCSRETA